LSRAVGVCRSQVDWILNSECCHVWSPIVANEYRTRYARKLFVKSTLFKGFLSWQIVFYALDYTLIPSLGNRVSRINQFLRLVFCFMAYALPDWTDLHCFKWSKQSIIYHVFDNYKHWFTFIFYDCIFLPGSQNGKCSRHTIPRYVWHYHTNYKLLICW